MRSISKPPLLPESCDSKAALEALRALSTRGGPSGKEVSLHFRSRAGVSQNTPLPRLAFKLLVEILKQTASGNA
jgi:hypothetical protein